MDYKMNYIPKIYRQETTDFYGLKGMSWHVSVVTYRRRLVDGLDDGSTDGENVVLKKLYLDHVCRNDTDKNAYAMCSILELVFRRIRKEVPNLKRIIIESDNAGCYNNKLLPFLAPFICQQYGLVLSKIIHKETGDGEGAADMHLATVIHFVERYIEE